MAKITMPSIIWTRGRKIAERGSVEIDYINNKQKEVESTVYGTHPYGVTVGVSLEDNFCECPYFPDHGYCKHIAAVIKLLQSQGRPLEQLFNDWDYDDDFPDKFPDNYLQLSKEFEQRLNDNPLAARMIYTDKSEYNRLRADPDTWDQYFSEHLDEKATSQATDFASLKRTFDVFPKLKEKKSTGQEFLDELQMPKQHYFSSINDVTNDHLSLEVTLSVATPWNSIDDRFFIRLRLASSSNPKFYVIKNIDEFINAYQEESTYQTSNKNTFSLRKSDFPAAEQKLMNILSVQSVGAESRFSETSEEKKSKMLNPGDINELKEIVDQFDHFIYKTNGYGDEFSNIEFQTFNVNDGLIELHVKKAVDGFDVTLVTEFDELIASDHLMIFNNVFYQMTPTEFTVFNNIINSYRMFAGSTRFVDKYRIPDAKLHFNSSDASQLLQFIAYFKQIGIVDMPDELSASTMTPHFDINRDGDSLLLTMDYEYDGQLIESYNVDSLESVKRNSDQEHQSLEYLQSLGFHKRSHDWVKDFSDSSMLYQFFTAELPNMRQNGVVTISDELDDLIQFGDDVEPEIEVTANSGLLSVNFSFNGIDGEEIDSVLSQLDNQRPYVQRSDGKLLIVDDKLRKVSSALAKIRNHGSISHGSVQMPASQALAVQAELGETAQFDQQFKQIAQDLSHPEQFDISDERPVNATLRSYQTLGIKWLEMLDSHQFGGILADEMGLGKTIQAIVFLNNHLSDDRIDLIISPASLIYNWQEEFHKFAPDIDVQVIDGSKGNRRELIKTSKSSVFITSYNSARLDNDLYQKLPLNYMILDEAQYVKNGNSKTNQSLRKLTPRNTFALSGTPIENRAEELWSIFTLVMPGLLPNKKEFKKLTPQEIAVRVKPFILRREKATVLKDLPPKVESNLTNEMTKEQKTVYLAQLQQMQVKVRGLSNDGLVKNKIEILAGLTRLRQICDTPALYLDDYKGDSGKLDQLNEVIRQAVDSNRHILIFSQFTSMLSVIENELKQNGLSAYVLKGDTKPKDRLTMVDSFNNGDKNIFLISLKAGGTGLNLTGADLVILVDLWWNPAVEDQATARAHRIGQKNKVEVYRLITKGTIEEQIYKLQEQKRNFVDQVLSGTQNKGSLTNEEIRLILGID